MYHEFGCTFFLLYVNWLQRIRPRKLNLKVWSFKVKLNVFFQVDPFERCFECGAGFRRCYISNWMDVTALGLVELEMDKKIGFACMHLTRRKSVSSKNEICRSETNGICAVLLELDLMEDFASHSEWLRILNENPDYVWRYLIAFPWSCSKIPFREERTNKKEIRLSRKKKIKIRKESVGAHTCPEPCVSNMTNCVFVKETNFPFMKPILLLLPVPSPFDMSHTRRVASQNCRVITPVSKSGESRDKGRILKNDITNTENLGATFHGLSVCRKPVMSLEINFWISFVRAQHFTLPLLSERTERVHEL